jgi:hypothetical protein
VIFPNDRIQTHAGVRRLADACGNTVVYREEDWEEEVWQGTGQDISQREETVMEFLLIGAVVVAGGGFAAFKLLGLKLQSPVVKKK